VYPDPQAPRLAGQAVHQLDRVEDPAARDLHPAEVERGVEAIADRLAVEEAETVEPQLPGHLDRPVALLELGLGQRDHQPPGALQLAVDAPFRQVAVHRRDVLFPEPGQPPGLLGAEVLNGEAMAVVHRLREHPCVAAARPIGRDTLLHHADTDAGVEPLEGERGP